MGGWRTGQTQGVCGPASTGQPCAQGGIAVVANNEPGLNLGAGNPIHLVTGNKYQQEIDLPAGRIHPRLEIVRHYNALDQHVSTLGQGWTLSYDTRLFHVAGRWQIVQADGSRITFSKPDNVDSPTLANRHGMLKAVGEHHLWTWPTGQTLRFDPHGRLIQIIFTPNDALTIHRHDQPGPLFGLIASVADNQSGALSFHYEITHQRAYLAHIDSPLGRFHYTHEQAATPGGPRTTPRVLRLNKMIRPDGMQRHYLYETDHQAGNSNHITGIEIVAADLRERTRLNTWAYDAQGRAIRSIEGDPQSRKNKVSIEYTARPGAQRSGITTVTGPSGDKTQFLTAIKGGRHVLLRVSGAACPGCAAPGSNASYDGHGRLTSINGTLIRRDASGSIERLQPRVFGWPELALRYLPTGQRTSWSSTPTGVEQTTYNAQQQPAERIFANGDRWQYRYDASGRPIEVLEKNAQKTQASALSWEGNSLTRIEHPHETESRQYDQHQRLSQRTIDRAPSGASTRWRYTESFDYDAQNRLVRHRLPEGGALHYQWGAKNRLRQIDWHDAEGRVHSVIRSKAGHAGYQYGNGLHLQTTLMDGQAGQLVLANEHTPIWTQRHAYNQRHLLQREEHIIPSMDHAQTWHYAYNDQSRLIGARSDTGESIWYAWGRDGSLAAQRTRTGTVKAAIKRDASGLPIAAQGYTLRYGPNRRLVQVRRDGATLDSYRHNAFGQRIVKQSPRAQTHYLYFNNRVVAESRRIAAPTSLPSTPTVTRRYIHAHHVLVGFIDYHEGKAPNLYAVHSDLIGAPRLVTDATQKIRWLASYSPTGAARQIAGDLTLNARLPGQNFDATTGWHDNLLRTYAPAMGHYLEPDPLGPIPGNQALGYARQQPRRYVDPLGLLLFAFDGTRNNPQTQTNVWKMSQHYQDGPVFYQNGPGSPGQFDWAAISAYNAPDIIEAQWQSLLAELHKNTDPRDTIPIDIIGFSRGAALARHFGNVVDEHVKHGVFSYSDPSRGLITACVDLRFIGLFDTVAQFGLLGTQNTNYDLTIAAAWEWVAHAVALQERRWLFPLTSAVGTHSRNTVEAPFIGAHSDIGGGLTFDDAGKPSSRGDLSDVALNWMLWQARAASLSFGTLDPADREITEPILHDQSAAIVRSTQSADRRIDAPDGSILNNQQNDHAHLGRQQRDATEKLVIRGDNWQNSTATEVGVVDMNGYAQWLHDELGWQTIPA